MSPDCMYRQKFWHLVNSIKSVFRRACGNTRGVRFDFKQNDKSEW
jgi:hypothetical protein